MELQFEWHAELFWYVDLGDYPDLGFDGILSGSGGAVYITSNQFTFPSTTGFFETAALNILPKSALYSGQNFNWWKVYNFFNGDGSSAYTLRAAKTIGDASGREYLVNTRNSFFGSSFVSLWRVIPTFPPTATNVALQATVTIGSYAIPPNAPQQGCSNLLDTNDNRIYNAVWRNGRIYGAFTQSFNFGSGTVAAIRYLAINMGTNLAEINTVYGADGFYYFYPAVHPNDADDITLVFARSNSSEFGGVHVTGRRFGFPNTEPSAQLQAGQECITGGRWGDYYGIARDPSDGSRIWVYGEWAKNVTGINSDFDWGTQWDQTRYVAPSSSPTPALTRLERQTGNFFTDGTYFCGLSSGCYNATVGADLAERINVSEAVEPGHVVEPDPNQPKLYRKARTHASGVISAHPGMTLANVPGQSMLPRPKGWTSVIEEASFSLMNGPKTLALSVSVRALLEGSSSPRISQLASLPLVYPEASGDSRPLLALMGRVPVKATTENGPIHPGDLLIVSATHPGYAMRCADAKSCEGAEVGKALEALESGEGLILVLVTSR
ncbi:hypothetical protein HYR54_13745 [Candidatus Acetothermia bacterium]|nr:hypothetical protein [Candidatus Acetothermia bacterium]